MSDGLLTWNARTSNLKLLSWRLLPSVVTTMSRPIQLGNCFVRYVPWHVESISMFWQVHPKVPKRVAKQIKFKSFSWPGLARPFLMLIVLVLGR